MKQDIKSVLTSLPGRGELAKLTGKTPEHIGSNKARNSKAYQCDVMSWQINELLKLNPPKKVQEILSEVPSDYELGKYHKVRTDVIKNNRERADDIKSYAYKFYLQKYRINKILDII